MKLNLNILGVPWAPRGHTSSTLTSSSRLTRGWSLNPRHPAPTSCPSLSRAVTDQPGPQPPQSLHNSLHPRRIGRRGRICREERLLPEVCSSKLTAMVPGSSSPVHTRAQGIFSWIIFLFIFGSDWRSRYHKSQCLCVRHKFV